MQIDLSSKVAIVSGSAGGIGFAIAKGLAESGATVVLNGPTQDLVDSGLSRMAALLPNSKIRGVAADLGTPEGVSKLVAAEPSADILINNLGIFGANDFFDISDSEWHKFLDVNVMSGVRLSRAYLPGMAERNWGRVIFISSESAINIPTDMIHYGVTKTALLGLSRGLAKRMAGTAVTVNAILPGPTLSEGFVNLLQEEVRKTGRSIDDVARDFIKANRPTSVLQRPASVEEVANLVVYVASDLSSATTGSALRVDGGVVEGIN